MPAASGEAVLCVIVMQRPLFDYVEQIRQLEKYIDVSRAEIRRHLNAHGKCHLPLDVDVKAEDGDILTATVRLNINTVSEKPLGWTMALKLHDVRIDGCDWEGIFDVVSGGKAQGWHRHEWNASDEHANFDKVPIDVFNGVSTREEFLIRGMSLLKVRLSSADHGQDLLDLLHA